MPETEQLMQGLIDSGCPAGTAELICSLMRAGEHEKMIRQMKKHRCTLMEEMHESQKKVDRMDYLIRRQEKQWNQ